MRMLIDQHLWHAILLDHRHNMRMKILSALIVMFFLSVLATAAHAGTLTVSYTPPTSCADGSALTECPTTGFEISESSSQQGTFTVKETVAATVTSRPYTVAAGQTRCYFVKTVSNTLKSDESTRACATAPFIPPKAPQGVTVKVEVTVTTP